MSKAAIIMCAEPCLVMNPTVKRFLESRDLLGQVSEFKSPGAHGTDLDNRIGCAGVHAEVFFSKLGPAIKSGIVEVILTQHENCEWYEEHFVGLSEAERKDRQIRDMKTLRDALLKRFPEITVKMFWLAADMAAEGGLRFEEVTL